MAEKNKGQKPSKVEGIKAESRHLRGEIPQELVDGNDFFGAGSIQLLKHHGTYQQDDREKRTASAGGGKSQKAYMFMVRSKIPGGKLTSDQLLAELDLCDEFGNETLRITSRQGLQLHGVVKKNLQKTIARINEIQLSTLGACGDVNRNVMCCPAPYKKPIYQQIQHLADEIADHFAPRTSAYHEIWLRDLESDERELVSGGAPPRDLENGQQADGQVEPIYGKVYLPRKFKMAIAFPHDNCVDIYTNDLGFLAVVRDDRIIGYNVLVGGGQGVTPAKKTTFPALAKRMAFVTPDQAVSAAVAVVKVQRDFGNRSDRKQARLKYLIHDWGIDRFKAKVEEYFGGSLPQPEPDDVKDFNDHIGWEEQGDGRWYYGLNVENGRIRDTSEIKLKTALREICRRFGWPLRLTPHQALMFCDVEEKHRGELEAILTGHGVPLSEEISNARRWSMACVAWPTCGLSITESERALPGIIDHLEAEIARLGLSSEKFTIRMTGCPNGCARPYNCDVGLVGKAKEKYTVLLGGRLLGDRLNFIYKDLVHGDDIVDELTPILIYYKQQRQPGESFGDFCQRKGKDDLLAWAEQFQRQLA